MVPPVLSEEINSLFRLRLKHPERRYSELLDAFLMARTIMPEGNPDDLERVASHILDTSMPRPTDYVAKVTSSR